MNYDIVLSGGSTKAPMHAGFLLALQEYGIKPKSFWGTSAGSIVAAYMALGHTTADLCKLIFSLNFNQFLDANILHIFEDMGVFKGDKLFEFLDEEFEHKTFKDLVYPCNIIAHCINTQTYHIFSNPDMKLSLAVRASCSIPVFFSPVIIEGRTYVDGGVSKNYAIDLAEYPAIGHIITDKANSSSSSPKNIFQVGIECINYFIKYNMDESLSKSAGKKTVISEYDISATNFNVSLEQKKDMIKKGYLTTVGEVSCL